MQADGPKPRTGMALPAAGKPTTLSNGQAQKMKAYIYPSRSAQKRLAAITNRALGFTKQEYRTVEKIIEDVKKNGDAALLDYTARFDGADMTAADIRVTDQEMATAAGQVDRDFHPRSRSGHRPDQNISRAAAQPVLDQYGQTRHPARADDPSRRCGGHLCPRGSKRQHPPGQLRAHGRHSGRYCRGQKHRHGHPADPQRNHKPPPADGGPQSRCP